MSQIKHDQELARIIAEYNRREATPVVSRRYRHEYAAMRCKKGHRIEGK